MELVSRVLVTLHQQNAEDWKKPPEPDRFERDLEFSEGLEASVKMEMNALFVWPRLPKHQT